MLYTLALAGTFAACTNEEFIADTPQDNLKADRPTVSNVTLNVTKDGGAATRLAFDGAFTWENGDKVAALLMDENNTGYRYGSATGTDEWNELTWLERYHLVDYVHTNFAFAYNASTGKWNSTGDCNMLEGNYFLTYPYVSFDGKRQAYYDISKQKQIGNTAEARRDAYAKNQVFVGYAQLEAKAGASVLNAKMSEVLAPIRINIQSNCTEVSGEPLTVNKIVLQNCTFSSHYTIDPTRAVYSPDNSNQWNLKDYWYSGIKDDQNTYVSADSHFNYANYLDAAGLKSSKDIELYNHNQYGSVAGRDYVYNIADDKVGNVNDLWDRNPDYNTRNKTKAYYYDDAVRKVVRPLDKSNWTENTTDYVEVYTYDSYNEANGNVNSTPMLLKSGYDSMLGVIAMVPEFENGCLGLYIYTNKGVVGPVSLDYIHNGNQDGSVQTTDAILSAHPSMKMQTVTVIIDDDDIVRTPYNMMINNTDDLINYVQWATINPTAAQLQVFLTNDVTIDDKLAAAIKGIKKENGILYFYGSYGKEANIKLATTSAQADILEYIDLNEYTLAEVLDGATVNLTQAAHNYWHNENNPSTLNILVDKGGVLNVTDSNKSGVDGWIHTNLAGYNDVILENNGVVNVKSEVSKNAGISLTNKEGVFNVESVAQIILAPESTNKIKGTINIAKGGELTGTTERNMRNYGIINNAGELYNVVNDLAEGGDIVSIIPGRIYITDVDALATLETNAGKVIYRVLPTHAVEVKDKNYTQGIFEFTTDEDVATTNLTKAKVTDFTITDGATLSVDNADLTLRHLTVKNAKVKGGVIPLVDACTFGKTAEGHLPYVSWNAGERNTIKLIGNSTVTDVKFTLNNNMSVYTPTVTLANDGSKKDITFNGTVVFLDKQGSNAITDLYAVTLTAEINSIVRVNKFVVTSTPKVSSTIKIKTGATVRASGAPKYDTESIVVSGGTIQ